MAGPESQFAGSGRRQAYQDLLAASGLEAEATLSAALQPVKSERRGVLSLAQCLEQPSLLTHQVARDYPDANDPRRLRAYLSVLQQDLALNVLAPLTLRLFRDGRAPLPRANRIFLAPAEDSAQTTSRWYQVPGEPPVDEWTFVSGMGAQTRAWYPVFRQELGVSPGAYWSSVGLGLGAPFSVVWNQVEPVSLCAQAQAWLSQFTNDANRFIDWIPAVFGNQHTAIPQRRGCCLKYLLPGGGYCGTCGVYRKERMAALSAPLGDAAR